MHRFFRLEFKYGAHGARFLILSPEKSDIWIGHPVRKFDERNRFHHATIVDEMLRKL